MNTITRQRKNIRTGLRLFFLSAIIVFISLPSPIIAGTEQTPEVTDPANDYLVPAGSDSSQDVRSAWFQQNSDGKIVFYMKVASLGKVTDTVKGTGLPNSGQWYMMFRLKNQTTNGDLFFVSLTYDTTNYAVYNWGFLDNITSVPLSPSYFAEGVIKGKILKSKNMIVMYAAPNTFTAPVSTAPPSGYGNANPVPGDTLYDTQVQTFVLTGTSTTGGAQVIIDTTLYGKTYKLTPFPPALTIPEDGFTLSGVDTVLHWDTSAAATSYRVQLSTTSDFSSTLVDSTVATDSLLLTGLSPSTRYYWRANATGSGGTSFFCDPFSFTTATPSDVQEPVHNPLLRVELGQNYPNPFSTTTSIRFQLTHTTPVTLKIYDVTGRERRTLFVNKTLSPGVHITGLDAKDFESGIYYYKIEAGTTTITRSMIIKK